MKRPSDDDGGQSSGSDSKAEEFISKFLKKHPRFFVYVVAGFVVLVVIALVVAKFSK